MKILLLSTLFVSLSASRIRRQTADYEADDQESLMEIWQTPDLMQQLMGNRGSEREKERCSVASSLVDILCDDLYQVGFYKIMTVLPFWDILYLCSRLVVF
jgi:hypothetical protein